jgi:hypothetical protein
MQARYRADYAGEFVVVESRWANGKKHESREWIANPIENQHISGRAACIGSTTDQAQFDHTRLERHRGGLLGSKKLQTYGTGSIAQQMRLDFAVETDSNLLAKLVASGYSSQNTVYTTPRNCIAAPGEFYLIPQNPRLLGPAQLLYLAAFDNHREVFLLGYNCDTPVGNPNWQNQVTEVMTAYPGVMFYLVGERTNMYDCWLDTNNVKCINHREFISYCDV